MQREERAPPEIPLAGLTPGVVQVLGQHLEAVRRAPRSDEAWGRLGALLKSYGFRIQAADCLTKAEKLDPSEPRWPYFQATLDPAQSAVVTVPKLQRAVALCGNDPERPRLRLAQVLIETGQEAQARHELQQLLQAKPDCGPARLLMAHLSYARGEWDHATFMANGSATNPYTARASWMLLAALHQRRGDTNNALTASRRAAALPADTPWPDPFEDEVLTWRRDPRSLSDRAQAYLMAGRPANAQPLINRLLQEHPDFPETWLIAGRAQFLQQQPVAAEQSLRRHLQLEPGSLNGHFQLGMSLLAQQRFADAEGAFREAIALKRDFGPAWFNLGFALAKSGQPREAVAPFREALRQNPEMIDGYILLADLHLQLGEKAEAAELAGLAERLAPEDRRLPVLRQKLK